MGKKRWSAKVFAEFERLSDMSGSQDQMERIEARLAFGPFIEKHGRKLCDEMFAELKRIDSEGK